MSSFEESQKPLERNLIFVGLALEKGWIQLHHITHAFTVWICDKTESLGEILVKIAAITPEQKLELDQVVERKLIREKPSVEAVSALENLEDLTSHLDFLQDDDLDKLLDRAMNEKRLNLTGLKQSFEEHQANSNGPAEEFFEQESDEATDRFQWRESLPEQGGMGELSIALDRELNRLVVVKKIKPNRAVDPLYRGLFQLEAEVTGHLEHPNIPPVYSLSKDSQGRDFFAMRYFKGKKLTEAIREYHAIPRSEPGKRREKLVELLQSFQAACLAVEYAHHRGVLHCDLKPDNIMVGPYGETLVIDWGLVSVASAANHQPSTLAPAGLGEPDSGKYSPSSGAHTGLHERQGGLRHSVGGTLPYMPPEQLQASKTKQIEQITCATDVFLLGATLYHLLTNRPPFLPKNKNRESASDLYDRISRAECLSPRAINPEIPKAFESIVKKAMRANPKERYQSPRELVDDLRRWLADEPTIAHPEGVAGKAGRWIRRNRKLISTTAISLFGAFLIGGLLIFWEQQRTLALLVQLQIVAENGFKIVEELEPLIVNRDRLTAERRKLLMDSAEAYHKIIDHYPTTIKTKMMAAKVFRYTANIHRFEFEDEAASVLYVKAAEIYKKCREDPIEADQATLSLAQTLIDQGQLLMSTGRVEEAEDLTRKARDVIDGHFDPNSATVPAIRMRCLVFISQAGISEYKKDFIQCEEEAKSAIGLLTILKDRRGLRDYEPIFFSSALAYLGSSAREQNKLRQSEAALAEARAMLVPYVKELIEYDQSTVREVAKLDILLVSSEVRLAQSLTWLKSGKQMDQVKQSMDMIVNQAELVVKQFPDISKYKLWLFKALATRVEYHKKTGDSDQLRVDLDRARKTMMKVTNQSTNLKPLGKHYLEALAKAAGE